MSLSITAVTLRFSDSAGRHTLGWALLCPETRYATIWWTGSSRPDRRHLADWRQVEAEIGRGLPAAPLPADSVIAGLFTPPD